MKREGIDFLSTSTASSVDPPNASLLLRSSAKPDPEPSSPLASIDETDLLSNENLRGRESICRPACCRVGSVSTTERIPKKMVCGTMPRSWRSGPVERGGGVASRCRAGELLPLVSYTIATQRERRDVRLTSQSEFSDVIPQSTEFRLVLRFHPQ